MQVRWKTFQALAAALIITGLWSVAQAGPARQTAAPAMPVSESPPNVVLILFDWARRDAIGAYFDKPVITPHIDRLAADGVRFANAYTTASLCSPARASILTGLYPHAHGVRKTMYPAGIAGKLPTMYQQPIADPFDDSRFNLWNSFPIWLHNSGFENAHVGKWHLGTGNPGFFDVWKSFNSLMPHWVGAQDASGYRPDLQTDAGVRFIQESASGPFFLYQSYYAPHAPFQPPQRYREMYAGRSIDHPDYYAAVTNLDDNVGRLVEALRKQGVLEKTLLILSADHAGSFRERPGSYRGMGVAYEEVAGIPLIMHWPDGLPSGVVWQSGVSLVDIAPTILSAVGVETRSRIMELVTGRTGSPFQGRDLVEEVRSGQDDWKTPVFIQNLPEAAIDRSWFDERAMRSQRWKLVLREFTADVRVHKNALFDMLHDPGEEKNLYYDKESRPALMGQLRLMLEWAVRTDDAVARKLAGLEIARLERPGS